MGKSAQDRGDPLNLIRVMPAKGQGCYTKRADSAVSIIGAGIAGAWQALLFAQAGHSVTLHERGDAAMTDSTSHWAGGMLAPWCEAEVAEPIISRLGQRSLDIWARAAGHPLQRLAGRRPSARAQRL
jgi:glycine/D-amino acid oxidase-like deaminating enzyme